MCDDVCLALREGPAALVAGSMLRKSAKGFFLDLTGSIASNPSACLLFTRPRSQAKLAITKVQLCRSDNAWQHQGEAQSNAFCHVAGAHQDTLSCLFKQELARNFAGLSRPPISSGCSLSAGSEATRNGLIKAVRLQKTMSKRKGTKGIKTLEIVEPEWQEPRVCRVLADDGRTGFPYCNAYLLRLSQQIRGPVVTVLGMSQRRIRVACTVHNSPVLQASD